MRERPGGDAEVVLTGGDEIMADDAPPPPGHRDHELRGACLPGLQGGPRRTEQEFDLALRGGRGGRGGR